MLSIIERDQFDDNSALVKNVELAEKKKVAALAEVRKQEVLRAESESNSHFNIDDLAEEEVQLRA